MAAGEPNGFKSVTAFYPEQENTSSNGIIVLVLLIDLYMFVKITQMCLVDQ